LVKIIFKSTIDSRMDVTVIGAGQAGLAVSYLLSQERIQHVVLERGKIGESWRSQRWDSFHLNTPNWSNSLPGLEFDLIAPDAFGHRKQIISYLERYADSFSAPVKENAEVISLRRLPTGRYHVRVGGDGFETGVAVIASGSMSRPRMPGIAQKIPGDILNLTAGTYKNAESLPDGAALVVGGAQSGCQIAEDLIAAGRQVYLCASRVGRVPRTYRGRDTLAWWRDMGFWDVRVEELEDPAMQFAALPQVSGTDGGHTVSFQSLSRDGVTLLGRVLDVEGNDLKLKPDLMESIRFADEKSSAFKNAIDAFIMREGITAPLAEPDHGEPALLDLNGSELMEKLDLRKAGISCVIWCTGFDANWDWLQVNVFDEHGRPQHILGISEHPGLYFIGFPWLSKRKSGTLYGIAEDTARIVEHICSFLQLTT
jgi:putative flavoprotein involved in K+ transport